MNEVDILRAHKALLSSGFYRELEDFLEERARSHAQEAEILSENLTSLLQREQRFGASRECQRLSEEFKSHIERKLREALDKEKSHA